MLLPAVGIHIAGQLHGSFLADQPQADAGVVDKAVQLFQLSITA